MQNTERQKFEENWKSAFDGAETTPPGRVWDSIDLKLTGEESMAMKKRVVFYQRLAAATVLFALLSGVYAFYPRATRDGMTKDKGTKDQVMKDEEKASEIVRKPDETTLAANSGKIVRKTDDGSLPTPARQQSSESIRKTEANSNDGANQLPPSITETTRIVEVDEEPAVAIEEMDPKTNETAAAETIVVADQQQPDQQLLEEKKAESTYVVISPLLQPTEEREEIVEPGKRSRETNLWLAFGASAGNYTPNTPSTTSSLQSSYAGPSLNYLAQSNKSEPKVGTAYSFGMAVGKKFGRVVVQTGVNLGRQQIEHSSNYDAPTSANTAKAASSDYIAFDAYSTNHSLGFTSPYTVNSTMEIVSIPVQAGYMIIDRRLGWQINAGVSPDFFLRNILTDESGQRERFTQSAGNASPYRSVNWSGLLNTELSYRIGDHYRLSFVPGIRYSFNSILKEPTNNGRPVIVDVGFRFRYLFD